MKDSDATPIPRKDVPAELVQLVDSQMKSLRTSSRAVHPLASVLDTELRVLDRLYYKSSSQQRSALFWKRACDVRRVARRMADGKLDEVVDGCRTLFFEAAQNIKRVAWTQIPTASDILDVLLNLSLFGQLLVCAVDRFRKAYQWFVAQLRTTAFAPLVTLLVGVVSRLHAVATEMGTELLTCYSTVDAIYLHIPVSQGARRLPSPRLPAAVTKALQIDSADHGLGSSNSQKTPISSGTAIGVMDDLGEAILRTSAALPAAGLSPGFASPALPKPSSMTNSATTSVRVADHESQASEAALVTPPVDSSLAAVKSLKKKKRKAALTGGDEIDAIFGF